MKHLIIKESKLFDLVILYIVIFFLSTIFYSKEKSKLKLIQLNKLLN
jgi:hypothetical protein